MIVTHVAGLALGIAIGLYNTLASLLLSGKQLSDAAIGLVSSGYFVCQALGSALAIPIMGRVGGPVALAVCSALAAATGALLPWCDSLVLVIALRVSMGIGIGAAMTITQSEVVQRAPQARLEASSGVYALLLGVGFSLGPVMGTALHQRWPHAIFGLGALAAGMPSLLLGRRIRVVERAAQSGIQPPGGIFLPLLSVFAYGFAEAALVTLYPVVLQRQGRSTFEVGATLSAFVLGALLATYPVALLCRRIGQRKTLALVLVISIGALSLLSAQPPTALAYGLSVLAGASVGPMYTIGMGWIGRLLPSSEVSRGMAAFAFAVSVGCIVGPSTTGLAMTLLGVNGAFLAVIAVQVIALIGLRASGTPDGASDATLEAQHGELVG